MKTLLPLTLIAALLVACGPYQYLTLNSDTVTKNTQQQFAWENDTVKLVYTFGAKWGQFSLVATNKSKQPLFIDWKKSALIIDSTAYPLFDPSVSVSGEVNRQYQHVNPGQSTQRYLGNVDANFKLPATTDFLPPATALQLKSFNLPLQPFSYALAADLPRKKDSSGVKYKQQVYQPNTSPLRFRIYLTLGIGNDQQQFSVVHAFYADGVIETVTGPLPQFMRADRIYTTVLQ